MTKLALVTGASSGLGKALAKALADQGVPLILVARDAAKLPSDLPVPVQPIVCDLAAPLERKHLAEVIHRLKPDLIINNAGFGLYGPFLSHALEENQEILKVNIDALVEIAYEGASALSKAGKTGTIVNISSAAAFFPYPTFSVYAASKAFVNSFSEGLDAELRRQGIRVLAVCPGQIDTGFRARASGGFPQKKDRITMSPQKAAALILKQVEKGKAVSVINFRYRLLVALARCLPKGILLRILEKGLKDRYRK